MKEFGSPSKNGLGHQVQETRNPISGKLCQAIFVPKLAAGRWNAEVSIANSITQEQIVDDDVSALRKNQLLLDSN